MISRAGEGVPAGPGPTGIHGACSFAKPLKGRPRASASRIPNIRSAAGLSVSTAARGVGGDDPVDRGLDDGPGLGLVGPQGALGPPSPRAGGHLAQLALDRRHQPGEPVLEQ